MRIGIITQPLTSNYGGILQNYALQQVLIGMGHEPMTFDTWMLPYRVWLNRCKRQLVNLVKGRPFRWPETPKAIARKGYPLRKFVIAKINRIPDLSSLSRRSIIDNNLDCLIVGSDQVWRPIYNYCIQDMFLRFADRLDIKKVAYAASFGTDQWEYDTRLQKECSALARGFDGISVREQSGIRLCREFLSVDAVQVLDPTLLLSEKDYLSLCSAVPVSNMGVFAYILDANDELKNEISSFANTRHKDFQIVSSGIDLKEGDTVERWIANIRDAECVITDSFHGTAMSILLHKEFYVLGNEGRGNSRFDSLLSSLDLQDRLIHNLKQNCPPIDWQKVDSKRMALRQSSYDWLLEVLNG